MPSFSFPRDFLWGSATSSYQVEGNNKNNDWFLWEVEGRVPFSCGEAVDFYHKFEEDFRLAKFLGHNAHRFSLEWSRIQPQEKEFNEKEITHYKKLIHSLLDKSIQPIVTLHHFTNPVWFYKKGCWLNPHSSDYFARYIERVLKEFSGLIKYWITINEPLVYIYNSYFRGIWPPGGTSLKEAWIALNNLKKAHLKAYQIIHKNCKSVYVSIAKHLRIFSPCFHFNLGQNLIPAFLRDKFFNSGLLRYFFKKKSLDFLAINYYTKDFVRFSPKELFGENCYSLHHKLRKNSLGWYISPEGLLKLLLRLKKFNLDIIITENGTTEKEDSFYGDFLRAHILSIVRAIKSGVKVRGYLWWSLIDNFEWEEGFTPKFGLIEVDNQLNRRLKPFSYIFRDICINNAIEI